MQRLFGVARAAAYAGYAKRGYLPYIVVVHFGGGDAKVVADALAQGRNHPALALERLIFGDLQRYLAYANIHCSVPTWPWGLAVFGIRGGYSRWNYSIGGMI